MDEQPSMGGVNCTQHRMRPSFGAPQLSIPDYLSAHGGPTLGRAGYLEGGRASWAYGGPGGGKPKRTRSRSGKAGRGRGGGSS